MASTPKDDTTDCISLWVIVNGTELLKRSQSFSRDGNLISGKLSPAADLACRI